MNLNYIKNYANLIDYSSTYDKYLINNYDLK